MRTILVIDDDSTFVKMIKGAIDSERYTVTSAADGEEGLKSLEKEMPDLILLDIKMPKMNGIEFLKAMNKKYGEGKVRVLVTSNISTVDQISEGVALGIRGYFVKSDESMAGILGIIEGVFKN